MNADNNKAGAWVLVCVFLCAPLLVLAEDWEAVGPFGGSVGSIAVDPREPSTILAGARNGQLFRSLDRGATWSQLSFGRHLIGSVHVIAIDPAIAGHYWAGLSGENRSSNGLWESRDGGESWMQQLAGVAVESLALFPGDSSTVAAGTRHGLFLAAGGGQWDRITPEGHADLEDIVSVAFDPNDARVIYAGTPHLPWKTVDGGQTWNPIHAGMIDDSDVFSLHVSTANPERVFASACSGIYRSQDAGEHWKLLEGIPNTSRRTHVITQHPSRPALVFAGTTEGLFRSSDGGAQWTRLNYLPVNAIAFDPSDPATLFLATERSGVQVSHDTGKTIRASNEGLHARSVAANAIYGSLQFASTNYEGAQGGMFALSGAGWTKLGGIFFNSFDVRSVTAGDLRLLASTGDRVYQSRDGGGRWAPLPSQPPGRGTILHLAGAALWAGSDTGLFQLVGSGWRRALDMGGPVRGIRSAAPGMVAWTDAAAQISSDAGKSWRTIEAAGLFDAAVSCEGSVALGTSTGVLVSVDGGAAVAASGIPAGTVSAVAFHGFRCEEAYASQFGRLYRSVDRGLTWTAVEGAGTLPDVAGLWVSSSADDFLYANVPGAGVFRIKMNR